MVIDRQLCLDQGQQTRSVQSPLLLHWYTICLLVSGQGHPQHIHTVHTCLSFCPATISKCVLVCTIFSGYYTAIWYCLIPKLMLGSLHPSTLQASTIGVKLDMWSDNQGVVSINLWILMSAYLLQISVGTVEAQASISFSRIFSLASKWGWP